LLNKKIEGKSKKINKIKFIEGHALSLYFPSSIINMEEMPENYTFGCKLRDKAYKTESAKKEKTTKEKHYN
jgi:hypothetical protein